MIFINWNTLDSPDHCRHVSKVSITLSVKYNNTTIQFSEYIYIAESNIITEKFSQLFNVYGHFPTDYVSEHQAKSDACCSQVINNSSQLKLVKWSWFRYRKSCIIWQVKIVHPEINYTMHSCIFKISTDILSYN